MTKGSTATLAPGVPGATHPTATITEGPATVPDPVITFRHGLFGFPECRAFTLHPTERDGLFWLQSVEHERLAFLLVDPFHFFNDYTVELGESEIADLEPDEPADIAVLAIVTLSSADGEPSTANLQGPVTINLRRGRGRQIVLSDRDYGVRQPIEL